MKYLRTFESFKTPQNAQQYNKGDEIVFIEDYDDKLKRGGVFKITGIDYNTLSIEDKEKNIIADIEFDGEVENYFKKVYSQNQDLDCDLL